MIKQLRLVYNPKFEDNQIKVGLTGEDVTDGLTHSTDSFTVVFGKLSDKGFEQLNGWIRVHCFDDGVEEISTQEKI